MRDSVGDDYPVGVRINGEEFTKEGNILLHSARIGRHLAGLDVDFISVSAGERFEDAELTPEGFPPFPGTGYSGARMSPRWWSPDIAFPPFLKGGLGGILYCRILRPIGTYL